MKNKILVLLLIINVNLHSQKTIFLENDSSIWTKGQKVKFAANTQVVLNADKEAISGVLSKSTYLWTNQRLIKFYSLTSITFNNAGKVEKGYLAEITPLNTITDYINFAKNTEVIFNKKGNVIFGFPENNYIYKLKNKDVEFKAKKQLCFFENGNVKSGTLAKRIQLKNSIGKTKVFKQNTKILFNEKMEVIVRKHKKGKIK